MAENDNSEVQINIKGPNELKLQITITADKSVLDLKNAIAAQSDVEAGRQRLIYSGRVLKDGDVLSTYKIKSGNTVHMVKGAAASTAPTATPAQIPTMQTGQNPLDPLTQLNSHRAFGALGNFNPFADMGLNQNDPNMMANMLDNPAVLQQMATAMQDPAMIDTIIRMNPEMAGMAPQMREMFQSERFRQMMSDPQQLRAMMQMGQMMRGGGGGGLFGGGGSSFPAPGVPTTGAPAASTPATGGATPGVDANPALGAGPGAGAGALGNPAQMMEAMQHIQALNNLMGGNPFGGLGGAGGPAGGAGAGTAPNPFGAAGAFGSPWADLGAFGGAGATPAAPADSRPPEERFQVQLEQLQGMGFTNAAQNVRALLATGGNVHSAIDYILGGGGLS